MGAGHQQAGTGRGRGDARTAPRRGPPPARPAPPAVEETGPVFFDEEHAANEPADDAGRRCRRYVGAVRSTSAARPRWTGDDPSRLHGSSPEAASAWQADAPGRRASGARRDRRVSWGAPEQGQPCGHARGRRRARPRPRPGTPRTRLGRGPAGGASPPGARDRGPTGAPATGAAATATARRTATTAHRTASPARPTTSRRPPTAPWRSA